MKKTYLFIFLCIFCGTYCISFAQNRTDRPLLQFTGVVIDNDSLNPLPYVNIIVKNSNRGTISDFYGFFSFVAQEQDTIIFSAIGYKKVSFVLPNNTQEKKFSLIQALPVDITQLNEVVIKSWPTKEQFNQAFINLKLDNELGSTSKMNLERLADNAKFIQIENDNLMAFRQVQQQQYSQIYASSRGTNNLLNPLAWAAFIKSWRQESKK